ncbi:MAG: hypothetical protein ACREVW_12550, partial [Burkholderiales bacterium]
MTIFNPAGTVNKIDAGGGRHRVLSTAARRWCNSIARIVICASMIALTLSHRAQAAEPAAGKAVAGHAAQVRPDAIG